MELERNERFDQVDWDAVSDSESIVPSINTIGMVISSIVLTMLYVYDMEIQPERTPTFDAIGWDVTFEMIDYFFIFTILLFLFYIVLPLFQNLRMTMYYWREFRRNRPAVVSLIWLGIVFLGGIFGPLLMKAPEASIMHGHQPPVFATMAEGNVPSCVGEVSGGMCHGTWEYPLGTTRSGKGVFTMIVYGMTISMKIAFITTTIVAAIGISVGTVSAYAGGWVDEILMRVVDIVLSFPTLLFFLLILYAFGANLTTFIIVFSIFAWGGTARYVRSKALSISEEEYIDAVRISGANTFQVVRRHVVPNTASSIITNLTLLIPGFLLAEAQLSYLGLGDPSIASWGQLIASGRSELDFAPWIVLAPGIVLFLTILAFNFLGDALLDALNPQAEAESE
ncbi:ABC-type dipeptide/oligopeptide/nickel transport system, permease component [Halovivax ruber XH-70]|uniref:ABC-type dipeptide/oligopeptide/nickel transport system, permease component n=1 Tax=Halovivax ruber (strain DSM 18193 / JCM 13892 / XH-70) TaxID=797302 RepID=L0IA38_HALRX|nr:ABC transporter permease [Halovivax ruber]AGB15693.1 ABC-type dipeptide/oligopeptide/nickel transport system, permease component [Halovivax ruber XH-70]